MKKETCEIKYEGNHHNLNIQHNIVSEKFNFWKETITIQKLNKAYIKTFQNNKHLNK
jgi:hypothetical protein